MSFKVVVLQILTWYHEYRCLTQRGGNRDLRMLQNIPFVAYASYQEALHPRQQRHKRGARVASLMCQLNLTTPLPPTTITTLLTHLST